MATDADIGRAVLKAITETIDSCPEFVVHFERPPEDALAELGRAVRTVMTREDLLAFAVWLCEGEFGEGNEEAIVDAYIEKYPSGRR